MASITVTPETLESKAMELEELNKRLKSQIDTLEMQEQSLNGMWEGEGHDAFHKAFNNDKIQMTNFYNAIAQFVTALRNAAIRYRNAENNVKNIVNQRMI